MESVITQVEHLRNEINELQLTIRAKEEDLQKLLEHEAFKVERKSEGDEDFTLTKWDILRYSRQVIVPNIGVAGQHKLKRLSVLIVGLGGLGCPASQYLAGAGVGHLGLVDYDTLEENNLHRQLLHNEDQLGRPKVFSAAIALKKINSQLNVNEYHTQLTSANALEIVSQYDIVVDASDNVATRYLVNDACVLTGRPLVSGSALQMEGQLTVYNHRDGPCYRCLYPLPPPPQTVTNCDSAGVLGPVPGVIGTLQALEVIKIALQMVGVLSSKLLLFNGETTSFRTINLRKKVLHCPVCGNYPSITELIDYEHFCGAAANDKDNQLFLLSDDERMTPTSLKNVMKSTSPCIIIDVRQESEFRMCSIPRSLNIPLTSLSKDIEHLIRLIEETKCDTASSPVVVCMVCRRGNDSQSAVTMVKPLLTNLDVQVVDLLGGLHGWAATVDPHFPAY